VKVKLVAIALLLTIFYAIVILEPHSKTPSRDNTVMGWVQISNRVGKAGATIYTDRNDPNLLPSFWLKNQPEPTQVVLVDSLTSFIGEIDGSNSKIIYSQGDSLILIKDPSTWIKYTPTFYLSWYRLNP
jgi:hypothetical protein